MLLMAVTFHYIEFTEVAEADMRRFSYFLVYMISLPELVVCLSPIDLLFRKDYTFRSNLVCIDVQTSFDTIAWHKRRFPSRVSAVALVYKLLKIVKLESAVKFFIKVLLVTGLVGFDSVPVGIVISRAGALILQLACYVEIAASRYGHVYITPELLLKHSSLWLSRTLARENQRLGCSQYSVIIEESKPGFMLPLINYTAAVTTDLRSMTIGLIVTYSMSNCIQDQCRKSCQYINEQRRSSPACTTTLTGEDRYCSCLANYTAAVTRDLRSTTLCLIVIYSMFSCTQDQCMKSCQYKHEQRRSSPACTTTLTGEDRFCSCLANYTAAVTRDLRSTTLCLIVIYSVFSCTQDQCMKSCQYIYEQRRSSSACPMTLTGEDRYCSCLTKYTAHVKIDLRSTTLCLIFTYSMFSCTQNQCLESCQYKHEQRRSSPACTTMLTGEDRYCSCLANYTAAVTRDLRSTTLCLIVIYSMFSCTQDQCMKSCQYKHEQRRSSPACTTMLTGEDRYCSCLANYTAAVTRDLRSTTLCLIVIYSMFSCTQDQCMKSCQYIYEQRRSSPACTTMLTGEDRYCSCLANYTAAVTRDLRSTTLCLIVIYSMFSCTQDQCMKSCQYIYEQRRSSPACTTMLTGEDRFCSCFYVPNNAQIGINLSICEIHTVQRTGAGGEAPHVQYKELLECVFFLCRRYYHGRYRADMVCWLKIMIETWIQTPSA